MRITRGTRIGFMTLATLAWLGVIAVGRIANGPRTWVVDDDGAGSHFGDISHALAAARDGDRILVRAGSYSGFVIDKRITLVGEIGATAGGATIRSPSTIAALSVKSLAVINAPDTVVFDEVTVKGETTPQSTIPTVAYIENSADVRFIQSHIKGKKLTASGSLALRVADSHVELVSTLVEGADGRDSACPTPTYGGDGGDGIRLEGTSRVLVMLSDVWAGNGGDDLSNCGYGYGGDGGDAFVVYPGGDLIVAGRQINLIAYGYGGSGGLLGYFGYDGDDFTVWAGATARVSGVSRCCSLANITFPTPEDPTLERIGTPVGPFGPGTGGTQGNPTAAGSSASSVTLRVHGNPGSFTRLFLGNRPQVKSNANIAVELLLVRMFTIDLGFMPASGSIDYELRLGPEWQKPFGPVAGMLFAQAACIYPGGEIRRTNSVPMVLR